MPRAGGRAGGGGRAFGARGCRLEAKLKALPPLAGLAASATGALALALPGPPEMSVGLLLAVLAGGCVAFAGARSAAGFLAQGGDPAPLTAGAGVFATLGLVGLDGGALVRWSFGLGEGGARLDMPDVGLVLAMALLASLGAAVLLAADPLAGGTPGAPRSRAARLLGRRALMLAGGLVAIGLGLVVAHSRNAALMGASAPELTLLVALLGVLGLAVATELATPPLASRPQGVSDVAEHPTRVGVALALAAALAAGIEGWLRAGSYLTRDVEQLGAAAMVGLAALEPTRAAAALRAVLLLALMVAIVR